MSVHRISTKQLLLLAASYMFYAIFGTALFLGILVASSIVNFAIGALLRRRPAIGYLWIGIVLNVGLLSFFKYFPASIVMPAGISFWTFQALSYLFDIYREDEIDPSLMEFC